MSQCQDAMAVSTRPQHPRLPLCMIQNQRHPGRDTPRTFHPVSKQVRFFDLQTNERSGCGYAVIRTSRVLRVEQLNDV